MVVLFTQVGMALLHSHRGLPGTHPTVLKAASDTGISCQACALDGMATLALEVESFVLPGFSAPVFVEATSRGILLPFAGSSSGRAPPFC